MYYEYWGCLSHFEYFFREIDICGIFIKWIAEKIFIFDIHISMTYYHTNWVKFVNNWNIILGVRRWDSFFIVQDSSWSRRRKYRRRRLSRQIYMEGCSKYRRRSKSWRLWMVRYNHLIVNNVSLSTKNLYNTL